MSRKEVLAGVSRETGAALDTIVGLLSRWQRTHNLIGPATDAEIWSRHVADSLQLSRAMPPGRRWADLGSGAGFPGLVLACLPEIAHVDLVESNGRKCAFLRECQRATGAPATIHCSRIEAVIRSLPRPDAVAARAVAPLEILLGWCAPWLRDGVIGVFPKGRTHADELTAARKRWRFEADLLPSLTDSEARIVRVTSFAGPAP